MKKSFTASILLAGLLLVPPAVTAQEAPGRARDKTFGIGLLFGEPPGASLKYHLSEESALQGLVGFSFVDEDDFVLQFDYLYNVYDLVHLDHNRLAVYFGGGPRYKYREAQDDLFGIRVVGGLAYIFDDIPVDVFFETGPVFDLTPEVKMRYTAGVGARFWF